MAIAMEATFVAMSVFALVDCNNFFVSCECIFRPDLEGKPVVVLSSNDGCAVARSNEAKALGIPMGAPAFKYREVFQRHNVTQFSANFDLYGNISRRIIQILTSVTPRIEVYSVDESFLDLSELPIDDYIAWAAEVRERIWQWVGVPVSIGIAPTKTLAKLASDFAKKQPALQGALDLYSTSDQERQSYLAQFPIEDIWGVGRRLAPRLRAAGIGSAERLRATSPQYAQQLMGIHGRQMVAELSGTSCYPLEREGKPSKSIAATRTFGHDTTDINAVEAALTTFSAKAAYKLRRSNQLTKYAAIFLTTDKHKPGYRRWYHEIPFAVPTSDTGAIVSAIIETLRGAWVSGVAYHRAGVMLYDFVPGDTLQIDLLGTVHPEQHDAAMRRMQAIDVLNQRYGSHTVRLAAEDLGQVWRPKHDRRSPRYVTDWAELPVCHVRA